VTLVQLAGLGAAALIGLVVLFQLALALGAPLGEATMGGRAQHVGGVLTGRYRLMALVSAVLLVVAALIVLSRAAVVEVGLPDPVVVIGAWVVVGFMVLNTLTNLSGRHPLERWGMSAITVAVALLSVYVALNAPAG
jgi:hypothetical protein